MKKENKIKTTEGANMKNGMSIQAQTRHMRNLGADAYKMMSMEGVALSDVAEFYGEKESLIIACIRTSNKNAVIKH